MSGVLRKLLGVCALLLVLAALYVSLGRQLVPLVAEYRDEIQDKAQVALGVPVSIGRLEGRWQGMAPLIAAHDVIIGSGDDSVRLDQVRVVPELLASLIERQVRLADLEVQGLKLGLRQNDEGKWQVEGIPARDPNTPSDPQKMLRALQGIARLSLIDSQLTVEARGQAPLSFTYANLTLRSVIGEQRLDARMLLPDGQPVALHLVARIDEQDWKRSSGELYASLPQSDWAKLLPPGLTQDWSLQHLHAGGEFWLNLRQGQVERAVARLHAPELSGRYKSRKPVTVEDLALTAFFTRQGDGFDVLIDSLALSLNENRWGDTRAALQYRKGDDEFWHLAVDRVDIGPIGSVIRSLAPLPDKAADALDGLNPSGLLSNISLDYRPQLSDAKRLQYSANLTRVSVEPWRGVPGVANASGSVSGDLEDGEGRTDSQDFGLHLNHLFPDMWRYRRANGQLFWHVDSEGWSLRMPYAQLDGEEGRIAGDFLIRMYKDPQREPYMDLRVGLSNGDARYTGKYLPTLSPAMSPALSEWLVTAIKGGQVDAGYFQYQGSLSKTAEPVARSISLYFRTHDAELAFQPGWPSLKAVRGEVLIEPTGVRVRAPEGRILDSSVRDVNVDIPHVAQGQVAHLLVDGQIDSSLPDALKILQEAPIGTAAIFAGWSGEGAVDAHLKLDIPLRKGEGQPGVEVDFATQNAKLRMSTPQLELSQVSGAFRFDLARGLSAPDVRAQVFERPVRGKIVAEGRNGKARSRIEANGRIAVQSLTNWLGVSKPLPVSGELPYSLGLSLDGADSQLRISSDLAGLAVELPAPFGKAAADKGSAVWRMTLQGNERRYWLDYAGVASLVFAAPAGQPMQGRGELRLGEGSASLPSGSGVRLSGQVDELDWTAWKAVAERYVPTKGNQEAVRFFKGGNLRIGLFKGFGNDIADLGVQLAPSGDGWSLALDSDLLKGSIGIPGTEGAPLQVKLERLNLPAPESVSAAEEADKQDPLEATDPKQIPALDIAIAQVSRGDQVLGAWALKTRPNAAGVQFQDLDLNLKGLHITGKAGWEGAAGASSSWYIGRLNGKNLADVLRAWGFAPTATSERFHLDADGRWPGSPAWLSFKRFSGKLDASMRNGQFVEVQGASSALRVFGLLNFNSIGRRLRLDFSDLLGKGFSYDRTKGLLIATNGVFVTKEPIRIEGPSSSFELNGTLDMARDQVDAKLLVTLPVTNNLPLAALIVGAPAIGGALFVVDKLLGDKVARFASVQYDVKGPWQEPEISFDKPFQKPN
ncbi:YhdP family protein [Pseudomonas sp. LRF_L74]|uniref:YhdP family protein n=1 Tax=Pseudomonas sp. LRF_L74 TaxID=3369422 RepID=UPI003F62AB5A